MVRLARRVHGDQRGTISILSVFAMLMFTMLMMLITNVALHVDDKVKMQNAADSAAYSGGVVLARGMNAIAFSNHLEADVFAITAFLREARDRNAELLVPEILAAWVEAGRLFAPAQFPKFQPLDTAIPDKTPLEQELVTAWCDMAQAGAAFALPVFEHILGTPQTVAYPTGDHLIPNFQRDVLALTPSLAAQITDDIARRHGPQSRLSPREAQAGALWRTAVLPVGVGDESDPATRTLPLVDPNPDGPDYARLNNPNVYRQQAAEARRSLAFRYLDDWIRDGDLGRGLGFFINEAKMSQFHSLFRIAACAQLNNLLEVEFPNANLPFIIREPMEAAPFANAHLERDFMFVGTAYREHVRDMGPRMFNNPLRRQADAVTFAQVHLFLPRPRCAFINGSWVYYVLVTLPDGTSVWQPRPWYDNWPSHWDSFNQNWMIKLVPATSESIPAILQTNPGGPASNVRLPNLGGTSMRDLEAINTH